MLKNLKQQNITILVATPYMDEASLCDRIALMQNGKILKTASPQEISEQYPDELFEVKDGKMYALLQALEVYPNKKNAYVFGETAHFSVEKNSGFLPIELEKYLQKKGFSNIEVNRIAASVEDTFIQLLK